MSNKEINNNLDNVNIGGDFTGGDNNQMQNPQSGKNTLRNGIIIAVVAGLFAIGAALIGLLK